MWKKSSIKILVFTLSIIALSPFIYIKDLDTRLLYRANNKIVFFSDSVMKAAAECEKNKSGIDDILKQKIKIEIVSINHGAYSAIVYKSYIKHLKDADMIIVPINMRSFSEEWFDNPPYKFYEKQIASSILNLNFLEAYRTLYELKTTNELKYLKSPIYRNGEIIGTVDKLRRNGIEPRKNLYCEEKSFYNNPKYLSILANKYRFHYMYELKNSHEMFKYLKKIIEFCKSNNLKILFYITPINMEYGKIIVGDEFIDVVKNNIKLLKNFLSTNQARYLDLSNVVRGENFIDHENVCEHLDYTGREIVANAIANAIGR